MVRRTLDRAFREAEDFDHEYRLLMQDGSIKYLHSVARAVRRASGRIEFAGAVTDVTIAKETEKRLRRSEAYLAEAQRLSHSSSWALDVHHQEFAYRSAELYRLFGFEPDQIDVPARAFQQRILADDFRRIADVERRAIHQGEPFEIDFRIARPDGSIRRVHTEGHPVKGGDGDVMEIIGTHVDVTEQFAAKEALQKAFDELKQSEQRFRDYAETASDWFWETGPDHRITRISEHADTASPVPTGLIGLTRWDIPPDAEFEPEKWEQHRVALDAHLPFRDLVYRSRDRNGSQIYVRTSGKPFHDENGNFLGYRGVSSDVTAASAPSRPKMPCAKRKPSSRMSRASRRSASSPPRLPTKSTSRSPPSFPMPTPASVGSAATRPISTLRAVPSNGSSRTPIGPAR